MNNQLFREKKEIEKRIEMKVEEYKKLGEKIDFTKKDTKKTSMEKNKEILEYKIQQKEYEDNILLYQYKLAEIDQKMIVEGISEKSKNGEMSGKVGDKEALNVNNFFAIYYNKNKLDSYEVINEKIEMQRRILGIKRTRGKITEKQYMDEMNKISEEEEIYKRKMEKLTQSIAQDIRMYKIINLKYQKNKGIITEAEFNEQIANLEKDNVIDNKFIDSEYERLLNISGVKQEKQIERIEKGRDKNSLLWSKEEYQAVVDYKGDYYNAINVLMSEDVTMREIKGTEKSKILPQSKEEFEKILEKTILVYSAIKKSHAINEKQQYNKKLFRGIREGKKDTAFLSTSDSVRTAFDFARMFEGKQKGSGTLLLIDSANVPWIDIDRLVPKGDQFDNEPEILFLPSKIEDLQSIDLAECFDTANNQGEQIVAGNAILRKFSSLRCKKVSLSEFDYSSEKSVLSKDDICNMFEQYKQDLNAIRKIPQNTAEYKELFRRIQNFKQKCCTWIHQKFYEINQSIDNQINMENDKIQVSPEQRIQKVSIGNTGDMYRVQDKKNNVEYYFKPAISKSGEERPYRAHIQEVAYQIQKIINPENAVKCNVTEINGMFGAIQEKIPIDVNRTKEFKDFFDSGNGEISPEIISQLVDEYLVDFCLCNYDSHSRNFIIDTNGKLRGIDKEQSFRYIKEDTSKDMQFSINYNGRYGENPTVYNLLFEKMKQGEISYKYLEGLRYRASRLAQYPDDQYRNIFQQYAYGKAKASQEAESLLDSIVDRKNNILQEIENLYNQICNEQYKNRNNQTNQNTENEQNPLHKKFSEQEIGKATINTPIQNKQHAMIREQKDIKQIQNIKLVQ